MKNYLLIVASSLLLLVVLIPLGAYGGHPIKFSAANIAYCLFTYYMLRRFAGTLADHQVIGLILLPVAFIYLPIHLLNFTDTLYSLPSSIAHFTGIVAGAYLANTGRIKKTAFISAFVAATLWATISGYTFWTNKVFCGTYTGIVQEHIPPFSFVAANGQTISSEDMKGQFVVLDFWNTGCASCFKKFPELQQYYRQYEHNSKVKIFAVNLPLSRDLPGQAATIIKKDGYTFPVLLAVNKSLASLFKIHSLPTVIVLDPSRRVIYRGQLDGIDETPLGELSAHR